MKASAGLGHPQKCHDKKCQRSSASSQRSCLTMMMLSLRRAASLVPRSTIIQRTATLSFSTALKSDYEYVKVEKKEGGVGLVSLHRPKALNALCDALFDDLIHAGRALDDSPDIGCMVLTGSPKAFAAGADISEMSTKTFDQVYSKVGTCLFSCCDGRDNTTESVFLLMYHYHSLLLILLGRICLLSGPTLRNSASP